MTESIDDLLRRIDDYKKDFYPRAIELHENKRLRELVKTYQPYGIVVVKGIGEGDSLYYRSKGFSLCHPKYYSGGWDGGYYSDSFIDFGYDSGGKKKLVVLDKELLDYFPSFRLNGVCETIEGKIIQGIKNLEIYKSATEKK